MELALIGLDGLEPSLVEKWADDLPTLRELISGGSFGRVRSSDPPLSAPAWPWIFTGKQGGKHGCFGFTTRDSDSYSRSPVNYSHIQSESLWEALDHAGVSCGIANVPLSYPPSDLDNGYVVSGWPVPNRVNVGSPPEIIELIEENIGTKYKVHPFPMGPELHQADVEERLELITEGMWHHQRSFSALAEETSIDFFFCVFMATDVAGHYLGRTPEVLREFYKRQDRALGELIDSFPSDPDIIVMSDHGHAAESEWNFYINEWLKRHGYLSTTEPSGPSGRDVLRTLGVTRESLLAFKNRLNMGDVRALLPNRVFELAKRVVPSESGDEGFVPSRVDWDNTVAYSADQNVVYFNTEENHSRGTISSSDAEDLRQEIKQGLQDVENPDPDREEPLMTEITLKDEVFEGPYKLEAPDLVPIGDDMHCAVKTAFNDGELFAHDKYSEHRQYGTLITNGGSFERADQISDGHILDIFPLVVSLLDAPIPEDVDGRIPQDRLVEDPDPTYRASRDEHVYADQYSAEESSEVREQLKGLGYLE